MVNEGTLTCCDEEGETTNCRLAEDVSLPFKVDTEAPSTRFESNETPPFPSFLNFDPETLLASNEIQIRFDSGINGAGVGFEVGLSVGRIVGIVVGCIVGCVGFKVGVIEGTPVGIGELIGVLTMHTLSDMHLVQCPLQGLQSPLSKK